MNYFEQNKKALKNRACCKKLLSKKEIKRLIKERKKYVIPEHIETLDANKQEADRTLSVTLDKLEKKRRIAEEKIEDLTAQWQDLTVKELEFREVVEYFNDSIIQIREKMNREKQKRVNLQENIKARCTAIDKIRKETTHFSRIIGGLRIETENLLIYEDFLNKFAEQYEFKAIAEVLQRYTVLFNTREDVLLKLEQTHSKSIKLKIEYSRFLQQCDEVAVRLSDVLTQQTKKYDDIKGQVRHWESIVYGVIFHMQRLWREINTTRDALEQVVCLLQVRLHPKVPIEVTCNKEKLRNMLSMKTGNLSYVNKRLGDLEKLRIKVNNLIEENKLNAATMESEKFQWWKRFTKKSHDASSRSSKKSSQQGTLLSEEKLEAPKTYSRFPPISACTAKTLEEIRISLFGTKKWDKAKRKLAKADSFSEDSESVSIRTSEAKMRSSLRASVTGSRRSKGLSNWEFLKELGNMTDEELMKTMAYLGPIDGKMFKREDIPVKPYTCSSVTADPLAKMPPIEKKINSRGRRIVERNFDRYEKNLKYPLRHDSSSLLKFNKETGNLELPKLKLYSHQMPHEIKNYLAIKEARKAKMEAMLPELASRFSIAPKRTKVSKLQSTPRKHSKPKKLSVPEQHKRNIYENLDAFLHIPAIVNKCNTDNL